MEQEIYQIYAIRYGNLHRLSSQNFIHGDAHDVPMPLDYFVWVIVGSDAAYVVDTGFDQTIGQKRERQITRPVAEGLAAVGVDPASIKDVILTHLHYDHAGNHDLLPNACYHVQEREMAFCTGKHMCQSCFAGHYESQDVERMVRNLFMGRLRLHDGDSDFAPGISLHHIGGHTDGQQAVRVRTQRGWVVLASDGAHFYANMDRKQPFPAVFNVDDMLEGFSVLGKLASSSDHIIPGHDPQVLIRYPAFTPATEGWIARLDQEIRKS